MKFCSPGGLYVFSLFCVFCNTFSVPLIILLWLIPEKNLLDSQQDIEYEMVFCDIQFNQTIGLSTGIMKFQSQNRPDLKLINSDLLCNDCSTLCWEKYEILLCCNNTSFELQIETSCKYGSGSLFAASVLLVVASVLIVLCISISARAKYIIMAPERPDDRILSKGAALQNVSPNSGTTKGLIEECIFSQSKKSDFK